MICERLGSRLMDILVFGQRDSWNSPVHSAYDHPYLYASVCQRFMYLNMEVPFSSQSTSPCSALAAPHGQCHAYGRCGRSRRGQGRTVGRRVSVRGKALHSCEIPWRFGACLNTFPVPALFRFSLSQPLNIIVVPPKGMEGHRKV